MIAAAMVTVAHRWVSSAPWLMVHLLMLGAVTTAILIWSAHFTQALRRRSLPTGNRGQAARLAMHTAGALSVISGLLADSPWLLIVGAVLVGTVALWHATEIGIVSRGELANRLAWSTFGYLFAAVYLALGVVCGVILAREPASADLAARVYLAHVILMLFGWVTITITATLTTLWPTMLAVRLDDATVKWSRTGVRILVAAVPVAATFALVGLRAALASAMVAAVCGIGLTSAAVTRMAVKKMPATSAALHVATGLASIAAVAVWWTWGVVVESTWETAREHVSSSIAVFVAAGVVQILVGALAHLMPMVLGGGPAAVRAARDRVEAHGPARFVLINGGLVLWLGPGTSMVKVAGSVVALMGALWLIVAVLSSVRVSLKHRGDASDAPVTVKAYEVTETPRLKGGLGALLSGAALLALAVGGIAADPAAAGLVSTQPPEVVASGNTVTVQVEALDMTFSPAVIEVAPGDHLVVEITNADDSQEHDLVMANGASSGRLAPGESAIVDVGIVGVGMDGWCSIAGHRQMGMTLEVVVDGVAESSTPETDHAAEGHSSGSHDGPINLAAEGTREPVDASLKPASTATVHEITIEVSDQAREVAPGVTQEMWTFNGQVPGPTLRGKVGDTFHITLVNNGTMGHSIDFHAGERAPDEVMRTIPVGESLTYTFTASRAGAWLYHCSTMPMSAHIANGMFGAVIIDPPDLEPVDREYVLVQSEMYLGDEGSTVDVDKVNDEDIDLVVFNGHATQYRDHPLPVHVGERVRIWLVDAGPNRASSFHVVGGQFDTVYSEGAYLLGGPHAGSAEAGGAQTLALQPGQGGFVEMAFVEEGQYPFVSHIMIDAERGAKGVFDVTTH